MPIIIFMKRLLVFLSICALLLGIRLGNGIIFTVQLPKDAVLYVYREGGVIDSMPYTEVKFWDKFECFAIRIDTVGDIEVVDGIFAQLKAKRRFEQMVSGVTVFYGYTPYLKKYNILNSCVVNLMIAYKDSKVSIGYPMLAGSY